MKSVEITPRARAQVYGALVKRQAEIQKKGRGTFVRKGPARAASAAWQHKKFQGLVKLERDGDALVGVKIRSRTPDNEFNLLKAFLGFVDRNCRDQIASIAINYH